MLMLTLLQFFVLFLAAYTYWANSPTSLLVTVLAAGYWLTVPSSSPVPTVQIALHEDSASAGSPSPKKEDSVVVELCAAAKCLSISTRGIMKNKNRHRRAKRVVVAEHLNQVCLIPSCLDEDFEWGQVDWEGDLEMLDADWVAYLLVFCIIWLILHWPSQKTTKKLQKPIWHKNLKKNLKAWTAQNHIKSPSLLMNFHI